jgi:uncharacterized LabA/DUF88 family protein
MTLQATRRSWVERVPLRVAVFIDEQNIARAVQPEPPMLDVERLAQYLLGVCNRRWTAGCYQLAEVVVCVGKPPHSAAPEHARYLVKHRKWDALDRVRIVEAGLVWIQDPQHWKQEGVDVAMGVDAVLAAERHTVDAVILATGDTDLRYAAATCVEILGSGDPPRVFMASVRKEPKPAPRRVANIWQLPIPPEEVSSGGVISIEDAAVMQLYSFEDEGSRRRADSFVSYLVSLRDRQKEGLVAAGEREVALTDEYLSAYWWWGARLYFPYCKELLDAWDRKLAVTKRLPPDVRASHEQVGRNLRVFQGARALYRRSPAGLADTRMVGRIQDTADRLRVRLDLDAVVRGRGPGAPRAAKIGGILKVLVARALGARSIPILPHDRERAAVLYEEAIQQFDREGDASFRAWTWFHWASLDYSAGDDACATDRAQTALGVVVELGRSEPWLRDYELMAEIARLKSDMCWRQGDREHALLHCAAAVFYAYAFQVCPAGRPDDYTMDVYRDIGVDWAYDRVGQTEALPDGDAEFAAAKELIRGWWAEGWDPKGDDLFPPGPSQQDVGKVESTFARAAVDLVRRVESVHPWGASG